MQHGHALLIRVLKERRPGWLVRTDIRMLEIGTTREPSPAQDSTRALARFCQEHGWDFTTCDIDPENTTRAMKLFADMGAAFTGVTARGEDYIASQRRAFDVVYLDAYDLATDSTPRSDRSVTRSSSVRGSTSTTARSCTSRRCRA